MAAEGERRKPVGRGEGGLTAVIVVSGRRPCLAKTCSACAASSFARERMPFLGERRAQFSPFRIPTYVLLMDFKEESISVYGGDVASIGWEHNLGEDDMSGRCLSQVVRAMLSSLRGDGTARTSGCGYLPTWR